MTAWIDPLAFRGTDGLTTLAALSALGRPVSVVDPEPEAALGLAFSSCFLARPSRFSMIPSALVGHISCKLQNTVRASSRTPTLTSLTPLAVASTSKSSWFAPLSICDLIFGACTSRKVLRWPVQARRVCTFFSCIPECICEMKSRGGAVEWMMIAESAF